jgi:hypothetical protein
MAEPESWTNRLLTGLAQHLADTGFWTYRPTDPYQSGDVRPVFTGPMPSDFDEAVELNVYDSTADPALSDIDVLAQLWHRGRRNDRDSVVAAADRAFELLHGCGGFELAGIPIVMVTQKSCLPVGVDANGRSQMSQNFRIRAIRPTPGRTA